MLVAGLSVTSLPWRAELSELKERLACVFQRSATREQVGLYLDGLVGGFERRNGCRRGSHLGLRSQSRFAAFAPASIRRNPSAVAQARACATPISRVQVSRCTGYEWTAAEAARCSRSSRSLRSVMS